MPTRKVTLTDHHDEFVAAEIEAGRFRDASEVMGAGLRLLELQAQEDEQKLALLRKLAKEGFDEIDAGRGVELNGADELRDYIATLSARAAANIKERSRTA
jgi:antitoxin ParD1/3/4